MDDQKLKRSVVESTLANSPRRRAEARPHERERVVDMAMENWRGSTGVGDAVDSAISSVKKGL